MRSRYRPLMIALGGLALFAAVFVVAGLDGWGPRAENEQGIGEVSRWCERVSGGFLREPVNTLGNLGFVAAGLAMFVALARDSATRRPRTNRFIGTQPIAVLYAAAVVFLGPGSMVMHGTHTRFGAWIDNVSMVTFILIPLLVNLAALGRWRDRTLFATYGSLLAVYAAGYWFIGPELGIGLDFFGMSIALWVISEVLYRWWSETLRPWSALVGFGVAAVFGITPDEMIAAPADHWWVVLFWIPGIVASSPAAGRRRYVPWFWLGVGSFLLAYAIWLTGTNDHPACDPDSLVQAHAIWHLLSAVATVGFFVYFRTERPLERAPSVTNGTGDATGTSIPWSDVSKRRPE